MSNHLLIVGVSVLLLSIGLSGCVSEGGADVRIVSLVNISEYEYLAPLPYNPEENTTFVGYNVTFDLKDINDVGTDVEVRLKLFYHGLTDWENITYSWGFDSADFYLPKGDITTITLFVADMKRENVERKIDIDVWIVSEDHVRTHTEYYSEII
jgi:hypothetical protein